MTTFPRILCLMGPTATGKTDCILALAKKYPIEAVSVDSALIYRQLSIGANKPSLEELKQCPHHLINLVNVDEPYNVQMFLSDLERSLQEILVRGKIPILVGGTMMYFYQLSQGLACIPAIDREFSHQFEQNAVSRHSHDLHEELVRVDLEASQRIHKNDRFRLLRALLVYHATNKPLSSFFSTNMKLPYDFFFTALVPYDIPTHRDVIKKRLDKMMDLGFYEEVHDLKRNYPDKKLACWNYVGYRQLLEAVEHKLPTHQAVEKAFFATCQLAKRQKNWLSKFDCTILQTTLDTSNQKLITDFESIFLKLYD